MLLPRLSDYCNLDPSTTGVIIAHAGSGKTTFAKQFSDVLDIDDLRAPALEARLQPLRRARRWDEHNTLWHAGIQATFPLVPANNRRIVLVHSYTDAYKIPGDVKILAFVQLEEPMLTHRLAVIGATQPERASLAFANHATNAEAIASIDSVPVFASFEALATFIAAEFFF